MQVRHPSPYRRRRRLPPASSSLHIAPFPLDHPPGFEGSERSCLTDVGLAHLARGCRGLEKLSLIWCSAISSTGLVRIAENCKNLTSLELQVIQCYLFFNFCCVWLYKEVQIFFYFFPLGLETSNIVTMGLISLVDYPCEVLLSSPIHKFPFISDHIFFCK